MSSQQASVSSKTSGGIVYKLINVFFKNYDSMDLESQAGLVNTITLIVRKSAHFLEYFILGLFSAIIVLTYNLKYKYRFLTAFVFCLLYAISDEIHQIFVQGRAGRFTDVCIDAVGSCSAIVIIILIARVIKKRKVGEEDAKKEIN